MLQSPFVVQRIRFICALSASSALLVALSCAGSQRKSEGPATSETTVLVRNDNWLDMRVFVLRGSQRVSLGVVTGSSSRVFTIPSDLVFGSTSLRFLADPIGSRQTPISQAVGVLPGEQIEITIRNY